MVNLQDSRGGLRRVEITKCSYDDLTTTGLPRNVCEDLVKVLKHMRTDQHLATDLAQRKISTNRWDTRVKSQLLLANGPIVHKKRGVFDETSLPKHEPSGLLQALCPVDADERVGQDSYMKVKEDFLVQKFLLLKQVEAENEKTELVNRVLAEVERYERPRKHNGGEATT